jgi:Arabinose efflux permease
LSRFTQASSLQAIAFYVMDRLQRAPEEGLQLAGVALTAGAAALIFAQLVVIPALKASPRSLMALGAGLIAIGNLELVFSSAYAAIVFGFIINSFGFGLARSGFVGGASLAVAPEEQGRAAGLTTASAGVGFLIAPVAGLWLYQTFGPETPFQLNAALSLAALALAMLHPRVRAAAKPLHEADEEDAPGPV